MINSQKGSNSAELIIKFVSNEKRALYQKSAFVSNIFAFFVYTILTKILSVNLFEYSFDAKSFYLMQSQIAVQVVADSVPLQSVQGCRCKRCKCAINRTLSLLSALRAGLQACRCRGGLVFAGGGGEKSPELQGQVGGNLNARRK